MKFVKFLLQICYNEVSSAPCAARRAIVKYLAQSSMYTVYILDKLEKLVSWTSQAGQAGPDKLGHELELAAGKLEQAANLLFEY